MNLVLRQGYSATTVDQICAEAGVTKGAFFHYFKSKEEIGKAAMERWSGFWQMILERAEFGSIADPVTRVFHLLDVMSRAYLDTGVETGCVVGTVAQEVSGYNRSLGDLAEEHLEVWKRTTTALLEDARPFAKLDFNAAGLAEFMMAIVQGTLLVAKSRQDRGQILNNMAHLRSYLNTIFGRKATGDMK